MEEFIVGVIVTLTTVFLFRFAYMVFLKDFLDGISYMRSITYQSQRRLDRIEAALQMLKEQVDGEDTEHGSPPG